MRRYAIALSISTAMMLAACGSETEGSFTTEDGETGEYTIDQENGEASMTVSTPDGEVSMRTGDSVPVDLPGGFSLVSGAEVLSNTVIDHKEGTGSLLSFRSDKSPEEIAEFYRAQAESAGVEIQIETSMNGGKMLGGENEATGLTFTVTAYPDDEGMTTGQVTIGEDPR